MMYVSAYRCPKCNGRLTYEELGSYGDAYQISAKTCKVLRKRKKRMIYEHDGDFMVYCLECGENYEAKVDVDDVVKIKLNDT